jgi:hypothetical protein
MPTHRLMQLFFLLIVCCSIMATAALGQDAVVPNVLVEKPPVVSRVSTRSQAPPLLAESGHAFWDRTNGLLFAGVAAVRVMDYASTRHFRARGANEILLSNSIVDNKPLFAGIEVAATAASIGVSYAFHRTGHHKLERWVSYVHIGVGAFGDARNYTLAGPGPAP